MEKGKVRWFSNKKGYGFILSEAEEDVFVHYSEIQIDGYKTLKEDQPVVFEVANSEKGVIARNVVPQTR
tara:strand:- start:455 stop:661 length:207 start_codon:yes stop_codon:yes gene_type:complete